MSQQQDTANMICNDKGEFVSHIASLMGYRISSFKINGWLDGLEENVRLDEARLLLNIEDVKDFILYTDGFEFCPQLFLTINKILSKKLQQYPGKTRVNDDLFYSIYSRKHYENAQDMLDLYAMCIWNAITYEPFEKFSLATTVLGITYLMFQSGVGYCDVSANDVKNIMNSVRPYQGESVEQYIRNSCFKLL